MPNPTLWPLEPHTLGKHKVLRGYLDAWFPILGKWNGRILFIDGFAGPGEYQGGEKGSPQIALEALLRHQALDKISAEVGYIFIEKEDERADHLEALVGPMRASLPPNCWIEVTHGLFDETMTDVLDEVDAQAASLAPAFVMVDPFGVSETPMSVIERILQNQQSEVYISFMYDWINRFKETPEFEPHLDELFGTEQWREGIDIEDPELRKLFFYQLYEEQVRLAGANQVIHFELYEGARLVYAIFFGSHHELGSDRMKQSIWRVAPWGDFAFRPGPASQMKLDLSKPDLKPLQNAIADQFQGRRWITIEEVMKFVMSDRTPFHSNQVKKGALIPLEVDKRLEVRESTRKRKRTYPDGTILRII